MRAHHGHVLLAGRDQTVSIVYFGQYCGLAQLEVLYRDGLIEIGIDELLLLTFKLDEPLVLVGEQGLVLFLPSIEAGSGQLTHLVDGLLGELHLGLPDALNFLLDLLYRDIRQVAICSTGVPAEAEEVAVDTTLAPGVAVAHASAAAVTNQRPLQVVGVSPGAVSGDTSPSQHLLHLVPGLVINERLVSAVVDQFAVPNLARVIGVREHAVDLAVVQRRANIFDGRAALESTFLEFIAQRRDAPVPTGVGLKGPADMLGLFFIKGNAFDFTSFDPCQRVDIPDWSNPVRAAPHGFLGNALLGLARQVAGVELGHAGEDVVHQHAGWGFVYLFAHRDKGGAGSLYFCKDHDVIGPVSGQTVELVHDDIVHPTFGHIGE
ncbi:MAG TPA: hypothetical protein VIM37_03200 [Candidatus Microsaccharimonas sp.]